MQVARAEAPPAPPLSPGTIDYTDTVTENVRETKPVDPASLPELRGSDRVRLGLENLRINVIREADAHRPDAVAIINLNRVFIGERIPATNAKLVGIARQGIAIEMVDSGERFFVRW